MFTRPAFSLPSTPPTLPLILGGLYCALVAVVANAQSFSDEVVGQVRVVGVDIAHTTPKDWHLGQIDWDRYQSLMRAEAGLYYRHLHPSWVLGIYAADLDDQRRFAELAVQLEHQRLSRLLDFNRAYREAELRLMPGRQPMDQWLVDYRRAQLEQRAQSNPSPHSPVETP